MEERRGPVGSRVELPWGSRLIPVYARNAGPTTWRVGTVEEGHDASRRPLVVMDFGKNEAASAARPGTGRGGTLVGRVSHGLTSLARLDNVRRSSLDR